MSCVTCQLDVALTSETKARITHRNACISRCCHWALEAMQCDQTVKYRMILLDLRFSVVSPCNTENMLLSICTKATTLEKSSWPPLQHSIDICYTHCLPKFDGGSPIKCPPHCSLVRCTSWLPHAGHIDYILELRLAVNLYTKSLSSRSNNRQQSWWFAK